jgi:carboxyl-terminal processing protease
MSRRFGWLVVILAVASLTNLFVRGGVLGALSVHSEVKREQYPALIGEVMRGIEDNYVEEVDARKLLYGALRGMTFSLNDPHSSFIEPDAYRQVRENTQGHFGGLGIVIGMRDGYLTVISPLKGRPAERAGIEAGDRILKISGNPTTGIDPSEAVERLRLGADSVAVRKLLGITLPEAVSQLRGPVGEPVTITVGREGEEPRDVTVTRERIEIESVSDVKIVDKEIGYLRLTDFREGVVRELNEAIDRLLDEGMQSLILDLRDNPGGLLESAVGVADRFIPDGKVIVSMRGRKKDEIAERVAKDGFPHSQMPLAVLVNEYSASGSEIVAGALQDWNCAVIIGKKTYGKGSVQNLIPFRDGSGLRLTTSRYYSPAGRVIDKTGVVPDVEVDMPRLSEKEKVGEEQEKEEKGKYDPQLTRAIDILKSVRILEKVQ